LQIPNQLVLCANFLVELKVINNPLFGEGPHFLVVMAIFIEDPLEVRYSFSWLYLLPYFSFEKDLTNKILVVIAFYDVEGELVSYFANLQLLL